MITDAAVETATAVLEQRGWERDEEMVGDRPRERGRSSG